MRQVHRTAARSLATLLVFAVALPAAADDIVYLDRDRDRGFSLPGVALPQGQDEVRAADGTTCRSAVGGSGAYLDMGAIKDRLNRDPGNVSTYARVVVPLGAKSSRLDCAKLYKLEIERLEMELRLLKMGISSRRDAGDDASASNDDGPGDWSRDGWSTGGIERSSPAAPTQPATVGGKPRRTTRG